MLNVKGLHLVAFLGALLLSPVPAFALAQLSITPATESVFVVSIANPDGVSGLEIAISYDGAILSNPRVEMGDRAAGMMTAVNTGNPIKVALVGTNPISASGTLATVSFDRSDLPAGGITSLTATAIDAQGGTVPLAQPVIVNPAPSSPSEPGADHTAGGSTPSPGPTGRTVGGTVSLPGAGEGEAQEKKEPPPQAQQVAQKDKEEPQPPASDPVARPSEPRDQEGAAADSDAGPVAPVKFVTVLERFRLFQGEKSSTNYIDFFTNETTGRFTQSPRIALADGSSKVTLTITRVPDAPRFTFHNAKFSSISRSGPGDWAIEVIPEKGVIEASVTLLLKGAQQIFPLTVAPKVDIPLNKPSEAMEAEFLTFLKQSGTAAAPSFDLNGDGKRDYVDDYIFTANYLVTLEERAKQKQVAQQKGL